MRGGRRGPFSHPWRRSPRRGIVEPGALQQPPRLQSGTHQQRAPRHRLGHDSAKQPLPSCGLAGSGHPATTGAEEPDFLGEAPDCGILEGRGPALGDGQTRDICFLFFKFIFTLAAPGLSYGTWALLCGMWDLLVAACTWDLVPTEPPALEARSLTHWTTREVPTFVIFK